MAGYDSRFDEEWQAFRCSDCDPSFDDPADPEDSADFEKPYVMLVPKGEVAPDYCPRCSSYLSMCEDAGGLRITNTPAERVAQEKGQT